MDVPVDLTKKHFDDLLTDKKFSVLHGRLSRFNIFSATGAERAELRHSNFLATLLDPNGSHGLNDRFLTEFLVRSTREVGTKFSPSDVVLRDWSKIEIRREWHKIDVLLFDRVNGFICCIENKIDAGEHGDQLSRYARIVNDEFPAAKFPHRLFLFLTPDRQVPSLEDFNPIGYDIVLEAANAVHADLDPQSGMGYVLGQYIELIGGKIMQDMEVETLCREIYRRHRKVLDKIIEFGKPDFIREISDFVQMLVSSDAGKLGLTVEFAQKNRIKIEDTTLDDLAWLKTADSSRSQSGRIVYFEFYTKYSSLLTPFSLAMTLESGDEGVRQQVLARCNSSPFDGKKGNPRWPRLWQRDFVTREDIESLAREEMTMEQIQGKIGAHWERFKDVDLPRLREGLRGIAVA